MSMVRAFGRMRWLVVGLAALMAAPAGVLAAQPEWMRPQRADPPAKSSSGSSRPQRQPSQARPAPKSQPRANRPQRQNSKSNQVRSNQARSNQGRAGQPRSSQIRRDAAPSRSDRTLQVGPLPPGARTPARAPTRTQTRSEQPRQQVGPLPPRTIERSPAPSAQQRSRPTARPQRPAWLDVDRGTNRGGDDRDDQARDRDDRGRGDRDRDGGGRDDRGREDRDRRDGRWDHDGRDRDRSRDFRRGSHFSHGRFRNDFGIDWHRPYSSHPFAYRYGSRYSRYAYPYSYYAHPRYKHSYFPRYRSSLYFGTGAIFDDCDPYWGTYSWVTPYHSRERIYIYNSPWSSPSYDTSFVVGSVYGGSSTYDPYWDYAASSTGEAIRAQQAEDAALSEAERQQLDAAAAESRTLRINEAWTALAEGRPSMAVFADLLTSEPDVALHRVGYAIGAARARQPERAEWAMLSALQTDPAAVSQVPEGARTAAEQAVERYRDEARAGRESGVTLAALLMAAGDAPAAAEALSALDPADPLVEGLRRVVVAELGRES